MGNIEIREQSNPKRRTQIFTDRNSIDHLPSSFRKSLTQRFQYNNAYSPIKYSKKSTHPHYTPLTQRKVNTDRIELSQSKHIKYYPNNQSNNGYKNNNTLNSKASNMTKIKSLQTQNFMQQPEQPVSNFNLSGKIVSNSRKVNDQRKALQSINSTLNRQFNKQHQGRIQTQIQNKDIIKKVRNFNDFLNQIKRKLKEDKQQNLFRNKYRLQNHKKPITHEEFVQKNNNSNKLNQLNVIEENEEQKNFGKTKSTRKIQVALKLENQKLQLQKYRKLVQRQLSKTHSIENISLCTRNSGQKILTIQYQNILPYNILSIQNSKASLKNQLSERSIMAKLHLRNSNFAKVQQDQISSDNNKVQDRKESTKYHRQSAQVQRESRQNYKEFADKQILQKKKQKQLVKKLKSQYQKVKRNMMNLGQLIQNYENGLQIIQNKGSADKILIKQESFIDQFSKVSDSKKTNISPIIMSPQRDLRDNKVYMKKTVKTSSENKIQKIENLFEKLYDLQHQYQEADRQIREAIQISNQQSNMQESMRQNFSSFAPNQYN